MGRDRSGSARSIRDSRLPRGMCTAPGRWPSSHSSCSRTSRTSGSPESSSSRARLGSTSATSDFTCWRSSRYVGIAFRNIATGLGLWSGGMNPRARIVALVAVAAVALAAVAVGVTLATRSDVTTTQTRRPPLAQDPTASRTLRHEVGEALAAWPEGTVRRLRILAEQHPQSAFVRLELGIALAFSGQDADAETAWREAEHVQPDSPSAVRSEDLRHPHTPPGRPPFVPSFSRPRTPAEAHLARGVAFQ